MMSIIIVLVQKISEIEAVKIKQSNYQATPTDTRVYTCMSVAFEHVELVEEAAVTVCVKWLFKT